MTLKGESVTLTLYSSPVRAIPQPSARRAVKLTNPPAVRPVHLKNPFPQPFYTTRRRQAATTLGAKPRQPPPSEPSEPFEPGRRRRLNPHTEGVSNDPGPQSGSILRIFSPLLPEIGNREHQKCRPDGGKARKLHHAERFVVEENAQKEGEAGGEVLAEAQYV